MFEKVFLHARGEAGARIARSIRRVGSDTATVRLHDEEDSAHLEECDESVLLGDSFRERSRDPWLAIAAARATPDVEAVHPGNSQGGIDPMFARLVELWADEEKAKREANTPRQGESAADATSPAKAETSTVDSAAASGSDTPADSVESVAIEESSVAVSAPEQSLGAANTPTDSDAEKTEMATSSVSAATPIAPPVPSIRFVGPTPEELIAYRDAHWMTAAATEAGLRVLEVSEASSIAAFLVGVCTEASYPLLVRRAFVGFDPGQIARSEEELQRILAEDSGTAHYLVHIPDRARHLEVYVAANGHDAVVVGEAETSVVRERRLMIAECPAPCLDALRRGGAVRASVWEAAAHFAQALNFRGVGVVHFVVDADGAFFFDGFSPGLSPSHTTVESCTSVDLVEAELQIAFDGTLPTSLLRSETSGHAILACIDASTDPRTSAPFASRVEELRWPPSPIGRIRLESGVKPKSKIIAEDSPTLATVTAYAPTRHEALLSLDRVIAEVRIGPVVSNVRVLRKTLNHESFRAATYDSGFVDRLPAGL